MRKEGQVVDIENLIRKTFKASPALPYVPHLKINSPQYCTNDDGSHMTSHSVPTLHTQVEPSTRVPLWLAHLDVMDGMPGMFRFLTAGPAPLEVLKH